MLSFVLPALLLGQQGTIIQYDVIRQDADAAITCGFCAGEKYGVIFKDVGAGRGLSQAYIPFTLNKVQVAVAATIVDDTLTCMASGMGGMVNATLEVYAGATAPLAISTMPAAGPWPGESAVIQPTAAQIELSVENAAGGNMWDVRLNELPINLQVTAPNTYVRVVFSIPSGGRSEACTLLGYQPPAFSPFRDSDDVTPRTSFIYQLGIPGLNNAEWTWNEDFRDPSTGNHIRGDWLVRLDITPFGGGETDAGVDGGSIVVVDTGVTDSGAHPDASEPVDTGAVGPADTGMLPPPFIEVVDPASAAQGDAIEISIIGRNFVNGLKVKLGAINLDVASVAGSTTIVARVPAGISSGKYSVLVENPDGQRHIKPDAFTITGGQNPPAPKMDEGCKCDGSSPARRGSPWFAALLAIGLLTRGKRRRAC